MNPMQSLQKKSLLSLRNLRLHWKDKDYRCFLIVQETMIVLGLFEYMAVPLAAYFIGTKELETSVVLLVLTGISFYISSKLGILTSRLLLRIEIKKAQEEQR